MGGASALIRLYLAVILLYQEAARAQLPSEPPLPLYSSVTLVNLIANGSFENLPVESPGFVPNYCSVAGSLPPDAFECNDSLSIFIEPWHVINIVDVQTKQGSGNCSDGSICFDLNANSYDLPGAVYTPIDVTSGKEYYLAIDVGSAIWSQCGTTVHNLSIFIGESPNDTLPLITYPIGLITPYGECIWETFTFNFIAPLAPSLYLTARSEMSGITCGPEVDNFRLYWAACFGPPPVSNASLSFFNISCANEWLLTPISSAPTPVTIVSPITITTPVSISDANITIIPGASGPAINSDHTVTIDGTLTLILPTIADGTIVQVINASQINGKFTSIEVDTPLAPAILALALALYVHVQMKRRREKRAAEANVIVS